MDAAAPVPILDSQGQPVHLLLQGDGNFLDLAAQLKTGQELSGRVVELLAEGKAVLNFRGIQVTAELAGVKLAKGEMLTVLVRDLGKSPAFQLVRPADPQAAAIRLADTDSAAAAALVRLGLPRDAFHGAIVRLLIDYGAPLSRQEVAAVKNLIARLPADLGVSAAPATPAGQAGQMPGEASPGSQEGQMRGETTPGLQPAQRGSEAVPGFPAAQEAQRGGGTTPGLQEGQMRGETTPGLQPAQRGSEASPGSQEVQMRGEATPGLPATPATPAGQAGQMPGEASSAAKEGLKGGETLPARSLVVAPQVLETAVFLRVSGLPAHEAIGRAVFEFLFGEARLNGLLAEFTDRVGALMKETGVASPLRAAAEGAAAASRRILVSLERGDLAGQLRRLTEGLGLRHEPDLAAFLSRSARGEIPPRPAGEGAPDSLKAALLELRAELGRVASGELSADVRASLAGVGRTAAELIQTIEAQQIGSIAPAKAAAQAYVQIPLAVGAEVSAGEMHVSWKRDREGKRRDPKAPAQMTIRLDTRALGTLDVRMQLSGKSLAISIGVKDKETRDFIRGELRWLVQRLSERNFRVDRCVCDLPPQLDGASLRAVEATASLDLKA